MKIIFESEKDCFLSLDNKFFEVFSGVQTVFDADFTNCFAQVYFNNSNILPYFFKLKFNNYCLTASTNKIEVFKLNDSCFYIYLKSNFTRQNGSLAFLSTKYNDYEVLQKDCLIINVANQPIFSTNEYFEKAKLYQQLDFVVCELINNEYSNLLLFDNKNNLLINEKFNLIEWNSSGFDIIKYLYDIHKHGIVKKYTKTQTELVLNESYSVYLNQTPKVLSNPKLINIAFFECIKAQNLNLAKKYLTTELSNKITYLHVSQFFGNFNSIVDTSIIEDNTIALTYENSTVKMFKIEQKNNLIDNIKPN